MQIGNPYSNYDAHLRNNLKMEETSALSSANPMKYSVETMSLKEGMVFKGQVCDILDGKVVLDLENELKLTAKLQSDLPLGVGDILLFSVKENTGNQILIKPMFDSLYSAQTQVLEKALDMAGLSPTEKNFAVAKELMEAGLLLDKGNMTKLLSQSMKFPDCPIHTLASLNKMEIPVTEENIMMYERYENKQHQISSDIKQTISAMTECFMNVPVGSKGNESLQFASNVVDLFTRDLTDDTLQREVFTETLKQPENEMSAVISTRDDSAPILETTQMDVQELLAKIEQHSGLKKEDALDFLSSMKQLGLSDEKLYQTIKESTLDTFLKKIIDIIKETGTDPKYYNEWMKTEGFKELFGELIKKNWSISPQKMKTPKEIDALYQRILKQGNEFLQNLETNAGDSKSFQQSFQNMKQNISFMEQINQQMIYAQMPLRLSNQDANSELYVYADKRKLLEKKDGISVMLHLDMDHLGKTDIKVDLKGQHINARFYLDDSDSVDLVRGHMNELAKQLGMKGFSLTNEVVKRQPAQSINQVVDEIVDENAERSIKRYTFDAKM